MGWKYVYGCNIHRGAEGDNSSAHFGITRRQCSEDGEGKRWHAVVSKTSPTPRHIAEAIAKPLPIYHNTDTAAVKVYVGAAKPKRKAILNVERCPELGAMYELSKGALPSRRLRFNFPDLFPEITEEEKPLKKRHYYQEPPRLVNSERLFKWVVPSVPWRYLQRRNYDPLGLPSASKEVEDDTSPRTRLNVKATPRSLEVGCQTTADVGSQTDVTLKSDCSGAKEVIVVESSPVGEAVVQTSDGAIQTETSFLRQKATRAKEKTKTNKSRRSSPRGRPSVKASPNLAIPSAGVLSQTPSEYASEASAPRQEVCRTTDSGHESPGNTIAGDIAESECSRRVDSPSPVGINPTGTVPERQEYLSNKLQKPPPRKRYPPSVVNEKKKPESAKKASSKPLKYQLKITSTSEPEVKEIVENKDDSPCVVEQGDCDERIDSLYEKELQSILEPSVHSNEAMTSMSMASSLESLEELERLIESQHAQLVAKGLLSPDRERQDSKDSLSLPTREATLVTESETKIQGVDVDEGASHSHSFSFDDSLADSSLSEMLEHLGISSGDIPVVNLSTDSSEMEKSTAAALAALTRFQSQRDPTDVVYDVCISKES